MTVRVEVRLPDDVAESIQAIVSAGAAESQTDLIVRAVRRELRRIQDDRDIATFRSESGLYSEFDTLHLHARSTQVSWDS